MTDSESTRSEYLRSQMSVMERVEVLERKVERLKANKATLEWAECTSREIEGIERRVDALHEVTFEKIEAISRWQKGDHTLFAGLIDDLARRVAEIELGLSASTPTGAHICPMELARLRRIEEAAREVSERWMLPSSLMSGMEALRAALDSEPKR